MCNSPALTLVLYLFAMQSIQLIQTGMPLSVKILSDLGPCARNTEGLQNWVGGRFRHECLPDAETASEFAQPRRGQKTGLHKGGIFFSLFPLP